MLCLAIVIPYVLSQVSVPGCCATNICIDSDQGTCSGIGGTFYSGQFCRDVANCGCCVCNAETNPYVFINNIYTVQGCEAACLSRGATASIIYTGKTLQECQGIGIRTISGKATDQNANPLFGATVTASPSGRTASTDSSGQYTLTLVNTGDILTAEYQGVTATKTITAAVNVYDFVLTIAAEKATINGNVKDSAGQPVADALLAFGVYQTRTNSNGAYTVSNINPGTYTLTVTKIGYLPFSQQLTFSAGETKTLNIVLVSGAVTLTGTVTDESNVPLQGISVQVQGFPALYSSTSSNGAYSIPNVPYGLVAVVARAPADRPYLAQTKSISVNATNKVLNFRLVYTGPCLDGTPRNTCSATKPRFCNAEGAMLENYCYGPDKVAGNQDDCGCAFNQRCQIDGSCKQIEAKDCCDYAFQCSNPLLPEKANCPADKIGCEQECLPAQDCPENTPLLSSNFYWPVCYCGADVVIAENEGKYCCGVADQPYLSNMQCPASDYAIIEGKVLDALNRNPLFAFVIINNTLYVSRTEDGFGFFSINVRPERRLTLKFSKQFYETKEITVTSPGRGESINIGEVLLKRESYPCAYPEATEVPRFQASTVKCKPYVALSWDTGFCQNLQQFVITRNDGMQWTFPAGADSFTDKGPDDEGLAWGQTYNYTIQAVYIDVLPRLSNAKKASIRLGQAACENRCDSKEFCVDAYKRQYCDNNNILRDATTARGDPVNCNDLNYTGNQWLCSGPNALGNTWCAENGACGSNVDIPFYGLFFETGNCYFNQQGRLQSCYLDRSQTAVDFCFQCSPHFTDDANCYVYQGEFACSENRCGYENCGWQPLFFVQTGEGVCYDSKQVSDIKYNLKDKGLESYCELCSKDARVFHNFGCDQSRCSKLGFCYSTPENSGSCNYCNETTSKCNDYTSRESCVDATGRNQQFTLQSAAVPETATYSDDACGLGRCYWDGTRCFKDGDSDRIPDCGAGSIFCQTDNTAPVTTPNFEIGLIDQLGSKLIFNTSEPVKSFSFCLYPKDEQPCTDFVSVSPELGQWHIAVNPLGYFGDELTEQGSYIIRFFSKDSNNNVELIKNATVLVDPFPPEVEVVFFTECLNCNIPEYPKESKIKISILANEIVSCTDELLVNDEVYSSQYSGDTAYEKTYPAAGGFDDGTYMYRLNCRDTAGNPVNITKYPKIDSYLMISNVEPEGPVRETGISFKGRTSELSNCVISIDSQSFVPMLSGNRRDHFLNRTFPENSQHNYIINCDEIDSDKIDTYAAAFVIDNIAPVTDVYLNNELLETEKNPWQSFQDNVTHVKLECTDPLIQGKPMNFGCSKTRYCVSNWTCIPSLELQEGAEIFIGSSAWLCYRSEDAGGNVEAKKCGFIHVDGVEQMSSLFNITLASPEFGVSQKRVSDFSIRTNKPAAGCRWVKNIIPTSFEEMMPFGAVAGDFQTHTERNFTIDELYPSELPVWVWCRPADQSLPEARTVYFLSYDLTRPSITSITADPLVVKEYPLKTTITVQTDDEARCVYGENIADYQSGTIFPGPDMFSPTNELEASNLIEGKSYTYQVMCMNRAGLVSDKRSVTFSVNLSLPAEIAIITPRNGAAYNSSALSLEVRTDKRARCEYSQVADFPSQSTYGLTFSDDLRTHTSDTLNFTTGSHTIYVRCIFQTNPAASAQSTFYIDMTPPENVTVNDGEFSCAANRLNISWSADDAESGIASFDYVIMPKNESFDEATADWKVTEHTSPEGASGLTANILYIAIVRARNKAGMVSGHVVSDGFVIDPLRPACSETASPTARLEKVQRYGGVEVTLVCDDDFSCNPSGDYYGIAGSQAECSAASPYDSPVLVANTSFFCWRVEDAAGNQGSGGEMVNVRPTGCKDDVDCDNTEDCKDDDIDGDGLKNWEDTDDDLDGISDEQDDDDDNDGILDFADFDCDNDLDNDGIPNGEDNDDDGDGINDCEDTDDDNDGVLDGPDEDDDNDGQKDVLDPDSGGTSSPDNDNDLDNDGIPNMLDDDIDGDGIPNWEDDDDDNDGVPDCIDQDDDNDGIDDFRDPDNSNDWDQDGMPNDWEQQNGLDPLKNDAAEDADGDGLTNLQEYQQGTNPKDKDTDKDGWDDFAEYQKAYDPLDPDSHPPSYLWLWILLILLALLGAGAGYYGYVYFTTKKEEAEKMPPPAAPKPGAPAPPIRPAPGLEAMKPAIPGAEEAVKRIRELRRKKREAEREKIFEKFGRPEKAELKKIAAAKEEVKPEKEAEAEKEDIFDKVKKLAKEEGALDKLDKITKKVKTKSEMERLVELSKKIKKPMSEMDKLMEVVKKQKKK
jgi:hypothetical protein